MLSNIYLPPPPGLAFSAGSIWGIGTRFSVFLTRRLQWWNVGSLYCKSVPFWQVGSLYGFSMLLANRVDFWLFLVVKFSHFLFPPQVTARSYTLLMIARFWKWRLMATILAMGRTWEGPDSLSFTFGSKRDWILDKSSIFFWPLRPKVKL